MSQKLPIETVLTSMPKVRINYQWELRGIPEAGSGSSYSNNKLWVWVENGTDKDIKLVADKDGPPTLSIRGSGLIQAPLTIINATIRKGTGYPGVIIWQGGSNPFLLASRDVIQAATVTFRNIAPVVDEMEVGKDDGRSGVGFDLSTNEGVDAYAKWNEEVGKKLRR